MEHECDCQVEKDYICFGIHHLDVIQTDEACIVCKGVNDKWDSNVLLCNHKAHTRCYRRYLFQVDEFKCPECGPLRTRIKCEICSGIGHTRDTCNDAEESNVNILIPHYGYKFRELGHTKPLKFQTKLDMIWGLFFSLMGWNWKYTKLGAFPFEVNIKNVTFKVKPINTNNYSDLLKESKKHTMNMPFLLVGNELFEYNDISDEDRLLDNYSPGIRIIGLISYTSESRETSTAILFNHGSEYNSLCWVNDTNWAFDLIESAKNNGKMYDCICKPASYYEIYDLKKSVGKYFDKLWNLANRLDIIII